jgi:hypothetical protein
MLAFGNRSDHATAVKIRPAPLDWRPKSVHCGETVGSTSIERYSMLWKKPKTETVREGIARAMGSANSADCLTLPDNLRVVLDKKLYSTWTDATGQLFPSFDAWVVHRKPEGLGLQSVPAAKLLRSALFEVGCEGAWAAVLPHIARAPGRPRNLSQDEGFRPFWSVSRAENGIDRKIMRLYRNHEELYARLSALQITLADAVREAGFAVRHARAQPICGLSTIFKDRNPDRQLEILESLWKLAEPCTRERFLEAVT